MESEELLHATKYISEEEFDSLNGDTEEIMKMIRSSILTKKKNLGIKTSTFVFLIFISATLLLLNQ